MLKINHMSRKIAVGMLTALSLSVFTPNATQAGVKSSIVNGAKILWHIGANGAKVFGGICLTGAALSTPFLLITDFQKFLQEASKDTEGFLFTVVATGTLVGISILPCRCCSSLICQVDPHGRGCFYHIIENPASATTYGKCHPMLTCISPCIIIHFHVSNTTRWRI